MHVVGNVQINIGLSLVEGILWSMTLITRIVLQSIVAICLLHNKKVQSNTGWYFKDRPCSSKAVGSTSNSAQPTTVCQIDYTVMKKRLAYKIPERLSGCKMWIWKHSTNLIHIINSQHQTFDFSTRLISQRQNNTMSVVVIVWMIGWIKSLLDVFQMYGTVFMRVFVEWMLQCDTFHSILRHSRNTSH